MKNKKKMQKKNNRKKQFIVSLIFFYVRLMHKAENTKPVYSFFIAFICPYHCLHKYEWIEAMIF